jgi:putative transposase
VAELRLCHGQGPARGDRVGPNPTDRAKNGTKRGVLTEAEGGPVAAVVTGANVHDSLLLQDALEAVVVEPPDPREQEQHLCLAKACDGAPSAATAKVFGYEPHIRRIGEERKDDRGGKTKKARRWVVERTIAWLNRCRGILIRYEKKAENYLAVVQLACALLWYRRLHRLTT